MTFFRDACGTGQGNADVLCAGGTSQGGADGLCAHQANSGQQTETSLCASLEPASPHAKSGAGGLCAPLEIASPAAKSGATTSSPGITCIDGSSSSGACSHGTVHNKETLAKAREICTMPHDADPAETFLMDILSDSGDFTGVKTTMSIKFFLPEELFDLWNTVLTIWLRRSVAEEAVYPVEGCPPIEMAEGFLAALLQDWLLTEKVHLKVTRDYAILKRDRFRCQVPGCNCRRNLHIHHIIWRSKGGTDDPANLIVLCVKHHLRLLHNLLTLKVEGTAPHNLTFTFGPRSHGDERPFLKYVRGRKVLQPIY